MNTAVWTLWLLSFTGASATPAHTALATYATQADCYLSIGQVESFLKKTYTPEPNPGLMFCVYGTPVKR